MKLVCTFIDSMDPAPHPDIQYQTDHIGDDRRPNIIAASTICLLAAYVAVTARVVSRRLQKIPLLWDDYSILVALVSPVLLPYADRP